MFAPDGYEDAESAWRRVLKRFVAEAWPRATWANSPTKNCIQATRNGAGSYDRMHTHKPDEIERRLALAADYGEAAKTKTKTGQF